MPIPARRVAASIPVSDTRCRSAAAAAFPFRGVLCIADEATANTDKRCVVGAGLSSRLRQCQKSSALLTHSCSLFTFRPLVSNRASFYCQPRATRDHSVGEDSGRARCNAQEPDSAVLYVTVRNNHRDLVTLQLAANWKESVYVHSTPSAAFLFVISKCIPSEILCISASALLS